MPHMSDMSRFPAMSGRGNVTTWLSQVDIGAAGAPTPAASSDPGFTWTRTGAGVYDVVFPQCTRGLAAPVIQKTAAATVFTAVLTARDMRAGTCTVRFNNAAGAATDPANGDVVGLIILGAGSTA